VELCRTPLTQGIAATSADHYVKRYPSAEFALALMLHFVLGLQSLRPGDAPKGVWAIDATFLTLGAKLLSRDRCRPFAQGSTKRPMQTN